MHAIDTWLKARRDYVAGKGCLPEIARRFGIPVQTVQTRAKREKWSVARSAFIARQLEAPDVELPPAPPPPPENPDALGLKVHRLELQLARLDNMLDSETDATKLDRLASASARLFDQWRILKNIPKPGSRRPGRERPQRLSPVQPLDEAPAPVANGEPVPVPAH